MLATATTGTEGTTAACSVTTIPEPSTTGRGATTVALNSAGIDDTCCPLFTNTLTVCRVGMFLFSRFY
eukprot:scaffold1767_cov64-Attheya_sp.AAC.5